MTMTATSDQPADKPKKKVKPTKVQDPKAFIKDNLDLPDREIVKISMANLTPSYWRVNVWGRKANSTCAFGDNEIIMSKFIRLDIDKDGSLVYNDVTDGKEI